MRLITSRSADRNRESQYFFVVIFHAISSSVALLRLHSVLVNNIYRLLSRKVTHRWYLLVITLVVVGFEANKGRYRRYTIDTTAENITMSIGTMWSTIHDRIISPLLQSFSNAYSRLPSEAKNPVIVGLASCTGVLYLGTKLWRRSRAMPIEGSLIVITGASQGIGAALAKLLASKGAQVVLLARNQEKVQRVALGINHQHGERATAYRVDCAAPEQGKCNSFQDGWLISV